MGMPKNLFLVRHGESEGNLVRRQFEDSGDESFFSETFLMRHESQYRLTEKGVEQAQKAGAWFAANWADKDFYRYLVSDNVRALQTAAHLNLPQAKWMIEHNLRERDGGIFNVITPSERDANYAEQQKFFDSQPFLFRPPQGESIADLCQRIKIVLDTLARECDGHDVVVVCHGHVMRAFRIILERMSLTAANEYLTTKEAWGRVPNCSIIHYTRENPELGSENGELSNYYEWGRMIRPAGGGEEIDEFRPVIRRKYSNEELLAEADKLSL